MHKGLNGNQLKLIAMVTMTVDHIGMLLFPQLLLLRLIGRLAFPLYAFLIAEGCRHTRNTGRYLGSLAAMAVVCQLAYFFAMGSLYQCVMVTFSLSVSLSWLIHRAQRRGTLLSWAAVLLALAVIIFLTEILPQLLPNTDYGVDYGFAGVVLPVVFRLCRTRGQTLLMGAVMLALLALNGWVGQWLGLLALPLIALYNGTRGKSNLKWIFYLYYPLHLVVLQGMSMIF